MFISILLGFRDHYLKLMRYSSRLFTLRFYIYISFFITQSKYAVTKPTRNALQKHKRVVNGRQ